MSAPEAVLLAFVGILILIGIGMWVAAIHDYLERCNARRRGEYHDFVALDAWSYRCRACGLESSAINPSEYLMVPTRCDAKIRSVI